jgi:CHAT domain-containing protein
VRESLATEADPNTRLERIDEAISYAAQVRHRYRLASLLTLQAAEFQRQQQDARAEQSLQRALSEIESQRRIVSDDELRSGFLEGHTDPFDTLVMLYARLGRDGEAFDIAERARARTLLDALSTPDSSKPVSLPVLQSHLPAGSYVVRYFALPTETLIWVISNDRVQLTTSRVPLHRIQRETTSFLSAIDESGREESRRLGAALHRTLIAPWAGQVPQDAPVFIVADTFDGLPFGALFDADRGRYVAERHPLMLVPSASVLVKCLQNDRAVAAKGGGRILVAAPSTDALSERLAATEWEATSLQTLYPTSTVLRGRHATKEAFVDAALRSSIVHFAGHAEAQPGEGAGRLVFNRGNLGSNLTDREIRGLRFERTRLVILASCESGRRYVEDRQGLATLAEAFIVSGVPAVAGSLWSVDDPDTARLMARFHRSLASGVSAAEALRRAQRSFIEEGADERAWSAFVIVGGQTS